MSVPDLEQQQTRASLRWLTAVGAVVLPIVALTLLEEARRRPNREALRAIRSSLRLEMPQSTAKELIRRGLRVGGVSVAEHQDTGDHDYVRVDTGAAAAWLLNVRYAQGKVAEIRVATGDGLFVPAGFPANQP